MDTDGWQPILDRFGWHMPPGDAEVEWRDYGVGGKPFVSTSGATMRVSVNLEWRPLRCKLIELGLCK